MNLIIVLILLAAALAVAVYSERLQPFEYDEYGEPRE